MTIIKRVQAPTPKFFEKVRTGGLLLAALGSALHANVDKLPPAISKIAGYMALAGGVISAVSQLATNLDGSVNPEANSNGK